MFALGLEQLSKRRSEIEAADGERLGEQNAWIESFNGRRRDELLNGRHFDSLLGARVIIEDWRIDYNEHSAHGDLTPTEFARAWTVNQPQAA